MQIEVSHKHFSTGAEVLAHAVAVRKRLMAGKPKPRAVADKEPAPVPRKRVIMRMPDWMTAPKRYDDHEVYWREWKSADDQARITLYATRRAHILGYSIRMMRTYSRSKDLDAARHKIVWECCVEQFPNQPYEAVGLVINRDHSSIIHSLQKTASVMGVDAPRRAAPARPLRSNAVVMTALKDGIARGERVADVAKRLDIDSGLAWRVARDRGWVENKRTWVRKAARS